MTSVKSYKDLVVWQKSMELNQLIYKITLLFPKEEMFGLTSQMRRAAVSVSTNIAEGQARNSTKEFIQFLGIAKGSLAELETMIMLSGNLGFMTETNPIDILNISGEISKMLYSLQNSLREKLATSH